MQILKTQKTQPEPFYDSFSPVELERISKLIRFAAESCKQLSAASDEAFQEKNPDADPADNETGADLFQDFELLERFARELTTISGGKNG